MKLTLAWLKEHLATDASLAKEYAPFRIARVVSAEKHPNADRLSRRC